MSPKSKQRDTPKTKRSRNVFKPDIRLANAIIGAIAFLQKSGIQATTKMIKKCIQERARKSFEKQIDHLPLYLNRGLELGILRRWHGIFKLGDFKLKQKTSSKKKKRNQDNENVSESAKHSPQVGEGDGNLVMEDQSANMLGDS